MNILHNLRRRIWDQYGALFLCFAFCVICLTVFLAGRGDLIASIEPAAAAQPIGVSTDQIAQLITYDGTDRILYIGECLPQFQNRGSALRWRIKLIQYDGVSTRITSVTWANNDAGFIHAWTLRMAYTY